MDKTTVNSSASKIDQSLFPNLAEFFKVITPPFMIVGSKLVFEKLKLLKMLLLFYHEIATTIFFINDTMCANIFLF